MITTTLEGSVEISALKFPVKISDPYADTQMVEIFDTEEELREKYNTIYSECVEEYDENNDVDFLFKLRGY